MKHLPPRASYQQSGATLIIVLIMLLLLAIIASISIRNSQTALSITTAAQVQQLLMQSSDLPLAELHMAAIDTNTSGRSLLEQMSDDEFGPIRLWQQGDDSYKTAEYLLCYQPSQRQYLYEHNQHRILLSAAANDHHTQGQADGYCHIASGEDKYYTSARKTVATQVTLSHVLPDAPDDDLMELMPFQQATQGIDAATVNGASSLRIRAVVSSVLPIMATQSSVKEIDACLQLPTGRLAGNQVNNNQIRCLNNTDVPSNIQVQDYVYHSGFE